MLKNVRRFSTCVSRVQKVIDVINSNNPLSAYPLIVELTNNSQPIPEDVMSQWFNIIKQHNDNPFAVHLFANLVTVSNVGANQFVLNASRLISLYIQNNSLEMCIGFISEILMANKGDFTFPYNTLESILISAKWHKANKLALQIVELMQESYPYVYGRTWGLLAQTLLETNDYEGLKWLRTNALIPGFLVLDDASYLKFAQIAARNGDFSICEWIILRFRRRETLHKVYSTESFPIRLYTCLIEAAAKHGNINTLCRYLVRLGKMCSLIQAKDLKQTVSAISSANNETYELLNTVCMDHSVHDGARTLAFNLILASKVQTAGIQLVDVIEEFNKISGISPNEETIILLLKMAENFNFSDETLQNIAEKQPTPRVHKLLKKILDK